jgi:hypothetical protein
MCSYLRGKSSKADLVCFILCCVIGILFYFIAFEAVESNLVVLF